MDLTPSLKDNDVSLVGMCPQILFAILVAQKVYELYETPLVITSLNDSTHSVTSFHYDGRAVDLRTRNLPVGLDPEETAQRIRDALGIDFDVLFEGDHIHIEWQPRRRG